MTNNYTRDELLNAGFTSVGENTAVSRDVRLFSITGSLGDGVRIDTYSILTGNVSLGDGVHIAPLCFLSATGGCITMQAGSGIGPQVAMLTKTDDYASADLSSEAKISGDILIGRNAIIGAGCKILPGVTVGADASVGGNCLVSTDIRPGDMIVSRGAANITLGNRNQ